MQTVSLQDDKTEKYRCITEKYRITYVADSTEPHACLCFLIDTLPLIRRRKGDKKTTVGL